MRVQANEAYKVQQLEEQIRQLNGRIEEMSFQLLQMQETIRKAQEDNEFRFQELEGGKGASPTAAPKKKAEASPVNPATPPTDDVATIIETPPQGGASILRPRPPALRQLRREKRRLAPSSLIPRACLWAAR